MAPKKKKKKKTAKRVKRPAPEIQVAAMAMLGLRDVDIAPVMGMSARSLRRHHAHELKHGRDIVHGKVAASLVARALDLDHPQGCTAAIFIAKCRLGWKEQNTVDVHVQGQTGVLLTPGPMKPNEWLSMMKDADRAKPDPRNGTNGAP